MPQGGWLAHAAAAASLQRKRHGDLGPIMRNCDIVHKTGNYCSISHNRHRRSEPRQKEHAQKTTFGRVDPRICVQTDRQTHTGIDMLSTILHFHMLGCVVKWHLLYITGCIALLTRPVTNQEVSRCYPDVNICLWTNGSSATTQSAAQTECRRRYNSFLPHLTDSSIQSKLALFRNDARSILRNDGFWISVKAVSIDIAHWIDGSPLAGMFLSAPYI